MLQREYPMHLEAKRSCTRRSPLKSLLRQVKIMDRLRSLGMHGILPGFQVGRERQTQREAKRENGRESEAERGR